MRPSSSVTMMPSWIVLKRVSRNPFSRDSLRTKLCRLCGSTRSMRPINLSRNEVFTASQPALMLQPPIQASRTNSGDTEDPEVRRQRVGPFRRKVAEVHSVKARDHENRQRQRRQHGEHLDDLIDLRLLEVEMHLQHVRE